MGVNIPIKSWDAEAATHGLLCYAAEAHRWAFLAAIEAGIAGPAGALCMETRLVKVVYHQEYSLKELGVSNSLSFESCGPEIQPRIKPVEKAA